MNFLKKTVGFLAVCGIVPAAYALTARPSVVGTASMRLPTMTAYINGSITSNNSSTSNLLNNAECIEAYTSCLRGSDVCGPNFEECTTDVLFHGQMPKCLSTLAQCTASGINALFGTSSTTALNNVATKNSYGEVTDYVYPTDGSVLGQLITGAAISNMYNTSDCVRRYTTCLQRDNVCGADFELCTTNTEFRKQMVFCDSTLARCQSDGKIELFGSTNTTTNPAADSRVGIMISEGAALAAVNAVSTCYKVADQCILNACATNPYKCNESSTLSTISLVDAINTGAVVDAATTAITLDTNTSSAVQSYIRNSCLDTIGANKYCYATFLGNGAMPTASQLSDADNQEDVFAEAYASRMNSSMRARINDLIEEFDSEAKSNCADTIKSCAMRVCGSGNGAACYAQVFGSTDKTINNAVSYEEIKTGCSDIVNTDPYCKYAAANPDSTGGYTYTYINNNAFDTLFPKYSSNSGDPIGVIASLNASLATSYSDAAIEQMRTRCENVAKSCVKSMCGDEYMNCYRNRTDIYSSLTKTGTSSFDNSMNKVGGVLDYTVVLGLCLDTVKSADICQEHLAIEMARMNMNKSNATSAWGAGTTSVRDGWIDAGASTELTGVTGEVQATDTNGNLLCRADDGSQGICDTVGANGAIYDDPIYTSYNTYAQNLVAETMFSELLFDMEKEAQAIYNSKLTQEQNMCLAANNGGIMTSNDTGSTYMWAKLRNNRVPNDYGVNGLTRNNITPSNELYGSFCAVRVTIQSDDTRIQNAMKNADWTSAYFAVGDAFTCGSWIPSSALEEMANDVASEETADMRARQNRTEFWTTLLGVVGGGLGGAYLGAGIQKGNVFNGLNASNGKQVEFKPENVTAAIQYINTAMDNAKREGADLDGEIYLQQVETYLSRLQSEIKKSDVADVYMDNAENTVNDWLEAQDDVYDAINNCIYNNARNTSTAQNPCNGNNTDIKKLQDTADGKIDAAKQALTDLGAVSSTADNAEKTVWGGLGATIGSVVLGTAGGLLVNKATRDIQDANLTAAEKAAYEEWMNTVGNHIRCYIGPDEVGRYGDVLSVTME